MRLSINNVRVARIFSDPHAGSSPDILGELLLWQGDSITSRIILAVF